MDVESRKSYPRPMNANFRSPRGSTREGRVPGRVWLVPGEWKLASNQEKLKRGNSEEANGVPLRTR
jgi:hypothetical protein